MAIFNSYVKLPEGKVGETVIREEEIEIIIHHVVCHLAIWQWASEAPSTIPLFGGFSHLYKLVVFQPSLITRWQVSTKISYLIIP